MTLLPSGRYFIRAQSIPSVDGASVLLERKTSNLKSSKLYAQAVQASRSDTDLACMRHGI